MAQPDPPATEGGASTAPARGSAGDDQLDVLNQEINEVVARRGDRSSLDLVADVEAVMRRHGVTPPSRDGVLQWIDEAIAAADHRDTGPRAGPADHR